MKPSAALLLLLFATGMAQAEWKHFGMAGDEADVYINPSSIRKTADGYKAWFLWDYQKRKYVGSGSYLSSKSLWEYDCKGEQTRVLSQTLFSEAMGAGKVASSRSDPSSWSPVEPDSMGEAQLKSVCPKSNR